MHQRTGPESDSTETVLIRSQQIASYRDAGEVRAMRFAMRISLAFGVVMLVGKMAAYFMTGSAARSIFSGSIYALRLIPFLPKPLKIEPVFLMICVGVIPISVLYFNCFSLRLLVSSIVCCILLVI